MSRVTDLRLWGGKKHTHIEIIEFYIYIFFLQIARAATLFCVNEIVIYDETCKMTDELVFFIIIKKNIYFIFTQKYSSSLTLNFSK